MNFKRSLYDVLGISEDASNEEVKKAFRAKSQQHHPDKGGEPDEFHLVCIAGAVLRDHSRRKEYDETGSFEEGPPQASRAEQLVVEAFYIVFSSLNEENIMHMDLILLVRKHLETLIATANKEIMNWKKNLRLQEKVIKKLKWKKKAKGKGLLIQALEGNIDGLKRDIREKEKAIDELKEAIEVSSEYTYEADPRREETSPFGGHGRPSFIWTPLP